MKTIDEQLNEYLDDNYPIIGKENVDYMTHHLRVTFLKGVQFALNQLKDNSDENN